MLTIQSITTLICILVCRGCKLLGSTMPKKRLGENLIDR